MKQLLLSYLLLLISINCFSIEDTCRVQLNQDGKYYLTHQDQVDSWQQCKVFKGTLEIRSGNPINSTISDLTPLLGLAEVHGSLTISGSYGTYEDLLGLDSLKTVTEGLGIISNHHGLHTLNGLQKLTEVGWLFFNSNSRLKDISAINNIQKLGSGISIYTNDSITQLPNFTNLDTILAINLGGNHQLIDFDGLQSIQYIENLYLNNNRGMTSFNGLNNLLEIGGNLDLLGLIELETLNGINRLKYIGKNITLSNNYSLKNLVGLDSLKQINGSFHLIDNDSMLSLEGANSLFEISDSFVIEQNDTLQTINDLYNLIKVNKSVRITDNPYLSLCCSAKPWILSASGRKKIQDNAINCNSTVDILDSCETNYTFIEKDSCTNEGFDGDVLIDTTTTESEVNITITTISSSPIFVDSIVYIDSFYTNGNEEIHDTIIYDTLKTQHGCDSVIIEIYEQSTQIVESIERNINVYPNPADQIIFIDMNGQFRYQLFDIIGQMILESTEKNIDASQLNTGIYTLIIAQENKLFSRKILIQR